MASIPLPSERRLSGRGASGDVADHTLPPGRQETLSAPPSPSTYYNLPNTPQRHLITGPGWQQRQPEGVTTPKTWSLTQPSWGGLSFCCPGLAPTSGVTDGHRGLGDPQTTRNRFFFWHELGPLLPIWQEKATNKGKAVVTSLGRVGL